MPRHAASSPLALMGARRLVHTLLASTYPLLAAAAPTLHILAKDDEPEVKPGSTAFWIQGVTIVILVLLGGCFAGLTLGLMGLDLVNLKVLTEAGDEREKKQAAKVLKLLDRGRHWVLVVLLLSNVIVNESLPIFLDNVLGGGVLAIVASTALIVIFGEIIPQSVCVRYGLAIGAASAPFVLALMYLEWPIAYPIAKLLDRILGEEQGTTYRKAELKTFVALHRQLGDDQLDEDTVTIISSVLELSEKSVESILTPIDDVFTLGEDQILGPELIQKIAEAGYSRIPVHAKDDKSNFIGMLLVKQLISYDPDDEKPVNSFTLAPLPETEGSMSCLEALNFFQQGRSHMLLISRTPGQPSGAVGVISLEDIIEELIDEEILDETDVFVDVKRKIRAVRRPPLGGRVGTTAGKGLAPLLKSALDQRHQQATRPSSPTPQAPISPGGAAGAGTINARSPHTDGGYGAMGTLSKGDIEQGAEGPTARAIEKVKVKGGTPQQKERIAAAGRQFVVRTASSLSRDRRTKDDGGEEEPMLPGPSAVKDDAEDENAPLLKKDNKANGR